MNYKKINIAIVGFGNIGSYFYKILEKNKTNILTKTGKLPLTNPIAKALEGTKEGDEVSVGPNTFKVIKLK